jgi:Protein of unknown function (DUF1194)
MANILVTARIAIRLLRSVLGFALLALVALHDEPAHAQGKTDVDVELILAIDASLSIDAEEAQLQRQGYIKALTDPKVIKAIQSGDNGQIAVYYFEWASEFYQRVIVDWTLIKDAASAQAVADKIAASTYRGERRTSISGAIKYAADQFGHGFQGVRRVIDISGDGRNNAGPLMEAARAEVLAKDIVINGLPILNDKPAFGGFGGYGYGPDPNLDKYYEESVVGGPGSFMIRADNFESFGQAILSQLIREVSGQPSDTHTFASGN